MNFMVEQAVSAGRLSAGNIEASDISLIIKEKITSSLLKILKPGNIIEADLIDVSAGGGGSLNGILSINGKLLAAVIPGELYDEFALGKAFDGNFNIPVRLRLESAVKSNINTVNNEGAGAGNGGVEIVFKVVADSSNNLNIQKALDLYNKAFSENFKGTTFESFLTLGSNISVQSITASVKGNFLFIHINFGAALGFGSVILTSDHNSYIKDAPDKKKRLSSSSKKYMLMFETEFNSLGHIKLFSYYSDKLLSVKFQECSDAARELINKNLESFRKMMSENGITLKEVSFNNPGSKDLKDDAGKRIFGSEAGAGVEMFSEGRIINERI